MAQPIRQLHQDDARQERRRHRRYVLHRRAYLARRTLQERVDDTARMFAHVETDREGREHLLLRGYRLDTLLAQTDWSRYPPDAHEVRVINDWLATVRHT